MKLQVFLLRYVLFSALLLGISWGLMQAFPAAALFAKHYWLMFGFISILTLMVYVLADYGIKMKPEVGAMVLLGSIVIKLLFCMAFALIYKLKVPDADLRFALNFFSLYLLFSAFEMSALLCNLRHQNL